MKFLFLNFFVTFCYLQNQKALRRKEIQGHLKIEDKPKNIKKQKFRKFEIFENATTNRYLNESKHHHFEENKVI